MNRSQAIEHARTAFGRPHTREEGAPYYNAFQHQAITLVDALEALGVLKFDGIRPDHNARCDAELARLERAMAPAGVIAKVVLGPDYRVRGWRPGSGQPNESKWLIGPGEDGADRIIEALSAAGYRIVKPVDRPLGHSQSNNSEFLLVEREA